MINLQKYNIIPYLFVDLPSFFVSRFGQNVKIVHFIGQDKPWLIYYDTTTGLVRPPSGQEHLQASGLKIVVCIYSIRSF